MHSLAVLTALLGAATAAPATLSALHKRDPVSCNAGTKSVGVKHMTINKDTTVNGTAKAPEKSYTKSAKNLKAADGLSIDLQLINNLGGDNLNAYISAADPDGKIFFMKQDGSQIFPAASGAEPAPITDPIAIPMPAQGETFDITIPTGFASGRIYFVQGELTFATVATDTGAVGLVQPDPSNPADPSCDLNWAFVEMTLDPNAGEIWANLSFVDMIGMIMSMTLNLNDGTKTDIVGVKREGVQAVCDGLTTQAGADGKPWGDLCMNGVDGTLRRILAPTHFQGGMDDYFDQYVNDMWAKYVDTDLTVDLGNGETSVCRTNGDAIECDGSNKNYQKPTAADIWGCNSGPFVVDAAVDTFQHQRIVPILCAAIHRATLGLDDGNNQPGPGVDEYYTDPVNNHYGRITHENQPDGRGYAFPYDDVSAAGGDGETAGLIHSTDYKNLVFHIGGMDQ